MSAVQGDRRKGGRPARVALAAAVFGLLILLSVDQVARLLPFDFANRGADLRAIYAGTRSFVLHRGANPYFLDPPLFYPAPYVVLLSPLGLMSFTPALWAARLLSAGLLAATTWGWLHSREVPRSGWLLLLSLPAVSLVNLGQLPTALGVAGFSAAIFAQRKQMWWLVGVGCAAGLIRVTNAPAVIAMLAIAIGRRPRAIAEALLGGAALLGPLVIGAFLWDPNWIGDYTAALTHYRYVGPLLGASQAVAGAVGPVLLLVAVAALSAWLVRRSAGGRLGLDRASAVVGISALSATLPAAYAAAFALPALLRASARRRFRLIVPAALLVPWGLASYDVSTVAPAYVLVPTLELLLLVATLLVLLRSPAR
jgi:hypothetical protein